MEPIFGWRPETFPSLDFFENLTKLYVPRSTECKRVNNINFSWRDNYTKYPSTVGGSLSKYENVVFLHKHALALHNKAHTMHIFPTGLKPLLRGFLMRQNIKRVIFFNWDSLHARLNSHYKARSYKKDYRIQKICLERTYS